MTTATRSLARALWGALASGFAKSSYTTRWDTTVDTHLKKEKMDTPRPFPLEGHMES